MTASMEASVVITLVDKVSGALGAIGLGMTKTTSAAKALQNQMNKINDVWRSGQVIMGGGMALAAPLVYATHAAMDLQTAMGRVQIATGASNAQMAQLNDTLTKTANATGVFSKPKLASFAADMYSSGIRDVNQINQLLPLFAKGADVMKILSHGKITPEEAAHTFSAMAHQFGKYDSKSMRPIVEAAVAMAPALPGGLKTLKGMGSYVNIMGSRALGIEPTQLMALQAAVAQTSGGQGTGRGAMSGANLINFLTRSMPGNFGAGLLTGKSAFAAATMGLGDKYGAATSIKNGKMDLDSLQQKIASFEKLSTVQIANRMLKNVNMLGKKAGEELPLIMRAINTGGKGVDKSQLITQLMKYQYGSAGTIGMLIGDPSFVAMLKNIQNAVKKTVANGGINKLQEESMKLLETQGARLQTNLQTLASTIGMQLVPVLIPMVTKIADMVDRLNSFATAHPKIVQAIVGLQGLAAAALILGGAGVMAKAGVMGLQFIFGGIGGALMKMIPPPVIARIAALSINLLRPVPVIGWVIAAISALVLITQNWGKISGFVKAQISQHADAIKGVIAGTIAIVDACVAAFGRLIGAISSFLNGIGSAIAGMKIPGVNPSGMGDWFKGFNPSAGLDAWGKKNKSTSDAILNSALPGFNKAFDQYFAQASAAQSSTAMAAHSAKNNGSTAATTNVTHVHHTNNITMQQVPGHDHDKCAANLSKKLSHAANGSSGGSVARPISQLGNFRH